ncbi:MAG: purine-binding chemotaxis protein CheW [Lachnospiraceae bacterium]|nr:purine-binding chemotaxis protein CheW [Lachnospiraceae bacterium]MBP5223376.1 purine-binding chemotaxis protein CheW [Lachnospiraceae bacterium]
MDANSLKNIPARDIDKIPAEVNQYIVVGLGNEQYGIDIRYVDNIVRMQRITRVPKMPNYLIGIINLRGEVLPVISLRLKMGLASDEYSKSTRIIILKTEQEGTLGVIVDRVQEVVTLDNLHMDAVDDLKLEGKNFVVSVGKRDNGDLISVLDLNTISLDDIVQS